jgi:hypothetical protein
LTDDILKTIPPRLPTVEDVKRIEAISKAANNAVAEAVNERNVRYARELNTMLFNIRDAGRTTFVPEDISFLMARWSNADVEVGFEPREIHPAFCDDSKTSEKARNTERAAHKTTKK